MADNPRIGRPQTAEAPPYHFGYIDQVIGEDILGILEDQLADAVDYFIRLSEDESLSRYAPDKWSVREMVGHMVDTERIFTFRALWFARGIEGELLSFSQETAAANSGANEVSWADHIEEFRRVRLATLSLLGNLPDAAWSRSGIASGGVFTVRALAFVTAGHVAHHLKILRERYRVTP
jgi:hypothetical protein